MPRTPDPIDDFLAPLHRLGAKFPAAEGHVLWAEAGTWSPQDDSDEGLDGDEIAYYAEGLLLEGFSLTWQAIAEADSPAEVEHILLFFQENPAVPAPAIPAPAAGWQIVARGRWPA
jgi:hypothetical protein